MGGAGPPPPPPGPRTHPGRAALLGKWQRQWKAAAQCAHRSASAPSPHTPQRAPGTGPCGPTDHCGVTEDAGEAGVGGLGGWGKWRWPERLAFRTAGTPPGLNGWEGRTGLGSGSEVSGSRKGEVKGTPAPLGCSLEKPSAPSPSSLVGPGPLQGWSRGPRRPGSRGCRRDWETWDYQVPGPS